MRVLKPSLMLPRGQISRNSRSLPFSQFSPDLPRWVSFRQVHKIGDRGRFIFHLASLMSNSSTDHMCLLLCGSALLDATKVPDRALSPNLLESNRHPTKSEELLICEEVETCDSRAIRLEADINHTQIFLRRLVNEQQQVKQRSQQLRVAFPLRGSSQRTYPADCLASDGT